MCLWPLSNALSVTWKCEVIRSFQSLSLKNSDGQPFQLGFVTQRNQELPIFSHHLLNTSHTISSDHVNQYNGISAHNYTIILMPSETQCTHRLIEKHNRSYRLRKVRVKKYLNTKATIMNASFPKIIKHFILTVYDSEYSHLAKNK